MSDPRRGGPEEQPELGHYFVSASQLKTWWDCNRKWGWSKLAGLKEPSSRGAGLGSLMHDQAEFHLRDGKQLNFTIKDPYGVYPAEILATGLQYIPASQSAGMDVERYFKFPVPGHPKVWIRGFKDYRFGADHGAITSGSGGVYLPVDGLPHVGDHKSGGNWEYALTADTLKEDAQALIYAYDELLRYPDAVACTLQWTYYGTKKKYVSLPVRVTVTREHVLNRMEKIFRAAVEVAGTFGERPNPLSLAYNVDTCPKYGRDGCPFKANCNLSPAESRPFRMSTTPGANTSSLLATLKLKKAEATGVPVAAQTSTMSPLQARIAAARAVATATAVAALPVTPKEESTASMYAPGCEPAEGTLARFLAQQPPAFPTTDQPINPPADFQPAPSTVADSKEKEQEELATILPEAPKAPGRPKGSKNAPKAASLEGLDVEALNTFLRNANAWFAAQAGRAS